MYVIDKNDNYSVWRIQPIKYYCLSAEIILEYQSLAFSFYPFESIQNHPGVSEIPQKNFLCAKVMWFLFIKPLEAHDAVILPVYEFCFLHSVLHFENNFNNITEYLTLFKMRNVRGCSAGIWTGLLFILPEILGEINLIFSTRFDFPGPIWSQ